MRVGRAAPSRDGFHYILSKTQEDDIRESFLQEKLKNYTMVSVQLHYYFYRRSIPVGRLNDCPFVLLRITPQEVTQNNIERPPVNSTELDVDLEQGISPPPVSDEGKLAHDGDHPPVESGMANQNTVETDVTDVERGHPVSAQEDRYDSSKLPMDDIHCTSSGETEPVATASADDGNDGNDGTDDLSDGGSSDGDMTQVVRFDGTEDGLVSVPMAGECRHDALPDDVSSGHYRKEPNGCAICLSPFEVTDKITWSSNPSCQHVFHDTCIADWLIALGRKHLKKLRREQQRTGNLSYNSDPVRKITGFPKLCPCCRQHFIVEDDDDDSVDEKEPRAIGDTENPTNAELGNDEAMRIATS